MKTNYYALFLVVSLSGMSVAQNAPTQVKGSEMKDKSRPKQINVERNVAPVQLVDTVSAEEIHQGQVQFFEVRTSNSKPVSARTIEHVNQDIANIKEKYAKHNKNYCKKII